MAEARPANAIYIGVKPVMNYVVACMSLFNAGMAEIVVMARGMAITKAVDTVEVVRRNFIKDLAIKSINIGTEQLTGQDGRTSNVSTIQITLSKPATAAA